MQEQKRQCGLAEEAYQEECSQMHHRETELEHELEQLVIHFQVCVLACTAFVCGIPLPDLLYLLCNLLAGHSTVGLYTGRICSSQRQGMLWIWLQELTSWIGVMGAVSITQAAENGKSMKIKKWCRSGIHITTGHSWETFHMFAVGIGSVGGNTPQEQKQQQRIDEVHTKLVCATSS